MFSVIQLAIVGCNDKVCKFWGSKLLNQITDLTLVSISPQSSAVNTQLVTGFYHCGKYHICEFHLVSLNLLTFLLCILVLFICYVIQVVVRYIVQGFTLGEGGTQYYGSHFPLLRSVPPSPTVGSDVTLRKNGSVFIRCRTMAVGAALALW